MPNLYTVTAAWPFGTDTPANIGRKFLATLDKLGTLEPWLSDWFTSLGETNYPIEGLRNSIEQWVADQVSIGDFDQPVVSNGYSLFAITNLNQAFPEGSMSVFGLHAGSLDTLKNRAEFSVGARPPLLADPAFITFDLYKAALLAIIEVWPSYWANASCYVWGGEPPTPPGEPPFPYSVFHKPWISYLSREAAGGLVPPPGIDAEPTPDGGLLMISTRERFDPDNVEHRRSARVIAEIMIAHKGGV